MEMIITILEIVEKITDNKSDHLGILLSCSFFLQCVKDHIVPFHPYDKPFK